MYLVEIATQRNAPTYKVFTSMFIGPTATT